MAITLAQARLNTQDDYDTNVINEFLKSNALLHFLQWHQAVNPAGGGATLDYSYRRQVTQRAAHFRAIGAEYTPSEVTTQKFTTSLEEIGGSYEIDRRIAKLGSALTDEITLQTSNLIAAANAKFNDAIINGDSAVEADSFDGLDKALTGSSTELTGLDYADWTLVEDSKTALRATKVVQELLSALDGQPTLIVGNRAAINQLKFIGRFANLYTKAPTEGITQDLGQGAFLHSFDGVVLLDPGTKSGSNDAVIPIDETTGETDVYAIRMGMDGFHGVTTAGGNIVQTKFPDFNTPGAVKPGEVFLENVGVALKATRAAAVVRGIKVQ